MIKIELTKGQFEEIYDAVRDLPDEIREDLNIDGEEHTATDYGVGPVDASRNAIQKITGKISEIRIKDYNLASISGGSTALCEVTVKLEDAMQNTVSSKSVGEDIVITSVQAVIDGMNRLLLKKILKQKKA